jgi:predicted Zn-dependent protease
MRSLWCLVILPVALAQSQQRLPGQGINFYSKDKEAALGLQLAEVYRQKVTPLDNALVSDYVKRVGARLAAQLPGGWTYQFETIREDTGMLTPFADRVQDDSGATHEPVAFPGGTIFVSANLIASARNEAEFAGMLAHAMGHVEARHWTRQATKGQIAQIGAQTQLAASMPDRQPGGLGVPMGMLAFLRANEREADYLGVTTMAAAGFDPADLASYIGRLQPQKPDGGRVFATVPDRDERVKEIRAVILKLPARTYETSDEFARVQAEIKPR